MLAIKILQWLKRWWQLVAGFVGGTIIVGIGAIMAMGAYQRNVSSAKDAIRAEKSLRKITQLSAERDMLMQRVNIDEARVERINDQLETNRRELVDIRNRADVPMDVLLQELKELGF